VCEGVSVQLLMHTSGARTVSEANILQTLKFENARNRQN
jgi:hypothetical protein